MSQQDQIEHLRGLLRPRMLRRAKADVHRDMPQKMEAIVRVDLTPEQRELYRLILTRNYAVRVLQVVCVR
jgi:SNF2 family DNA or RNA helicase